MKIPYDPHVWDEWRELENGMIQANFVVPPDAFQTETAKPIDPFAAPPADKNYEQSDAKTVLKRYGIVFEEGASATYYPETGLLTVTQTREQMELVAAVFAGRCDRREPRIHIGTEIYELPALDALEIIESLKPQGEHTPERDALLREAPRKNRVRLVAAPTIIARSGQRAKTEELIETVNRPEPTKGEEPEPAWEQYPTLSLEVDPIIGGDNYTMDINFQVTFAPKEVPEFSRNLTTQVVTYDGQWIFVGNWSGRTPDTMMLIFLNATIQTLGDAGEMVKVEKSQL